MEKKKLLLICDAAVDTGFAKVAHSLIEYWYTTWDISVLAVNYRGDHYPLLEGKAKLYNPTAHDSGDYYGFGRLPSLLGRLRPDVVCIINDPWILSQYIHVIRSTPCPAKIVFYTPVDAVNLKNIYVEPLNQFDCGIAYTEFGAKELQFSGYTKDIFIIPHGIKNTEFYPMDKEEVRAKIIERGLVPNFSQNDYIVQVVDRNSQRKRIDLAMYGFALWARDKPEHVKLWYHGALIDEGYDIAQLAWYFGIQDRMIYTSTTITPDRGVPIDVMNAVYNVANVRVSTSGGEGWGLCSMESMATRTANMVVNTAALSEWARGGVHYLKPSTIPYVTIKGLNTIHAQADIDDYVQSLDRMYYDTMYRDYIAEAGYALVSQEKFSWSTIANQFTEVFNDTLRRDQEVV